MNNPTILGRDPGMVAALVGSLIIVTSLFIYPLSIDQQGALNAGVAALVGIVTWRLVQADGHVALLSGLAKAAMAIALSFGLHLDQEHQAAAMGAMLMIFQFVERTQMTAAAPPVQKSS